MLQGERTSLRLAGFYRAYQNKTILIELVYISHLQEASLNFILTSDYYTKVFINISLITFCSMLASSSKGEVLSNDLPRLRFSSHLC